MLFLGAILFVLIALILSATFAVGYKKGQQSERNKS